MKLITKYKDTYNLFTITHKDVITLGRRSISRETYEPILHESQEFNNYGSANIYNQNLGTGNNYGGAFYYDFDTEIWMGGYYYDTADDNMYSFFQYNRDKIYMTQHLTLKNGDTTGCHAYHPVVIKWDKTRTPIMMAQHIGTDPNSHPREMYYMLHDVDANTAHGIHMAARAFQHTHIPEFRFDDMNWTYKYYDNADDWPRHDRNGVQLIHVNESTGDLYWFANASSSSQVSVVKRDNSGNKFYLNIDAGDAHKYLASIQGGDSIDGLTHMYRYRANYLSQWQEFDAVALKGWKYYPLVKQNSNNTHSLPLILKYNFDLNGVDAEFPDSLEECAIDWGDYDPDTNMFNSAAGHEYTKIDTDCWTFEKENGEKILNFVFTYSYGFCYLLTFTVSPEDPKVLTYNQDMLTFKSHNNYPRFHCITKDFKLLLLNRQLRHHEFIEWNDQQGWVYKDFVYSDDYILYDHNKRRVITKTVSTGMPGYNVYSFQKARISLTGLKDKYIYTDTDITENLKLNVYDSATRVETKIVIRILTPNAKILAPSIVYNPYDNTTISYTADNVANEADLDRVMFDNATTYDPDDPAVAYDMFYNGDVPSENISGDYADVGPAAITADTEFIDTSVQPANVTDIEFKINSMPTGDFYLFGATASDADRFYFSRIGGTWGIGLGDSDYSIDPVSFNEDTNSWVDGVTTVSATWDGDSLEIFQDGVSLGSKSLTATGGSLTANTLYIGNANSVATPAGAITTFSDIYVNKVTTTEPDGTNDPMNIIFESTEINTTWGEMITTADAVNTYNTSKFKVYSSMDGVTWNLEYTNTHEQNDEKSHPMNFVAKYAKIEVLENNVDDGIGRILVKKDSADPQPWWNITIPIFSPEPVETHIGEFTSSSVAETTVPLIIKGSGSVEIETYAMSMADHESAFGVTPEPTE